MMKIKLIKYWFDMISKCIMLVKKIVCYTGLQPIWHNYLKLCISKAYQMVSNYSDFRCGPFSQWPLECVRFRSLLRAEEWSTNDQNVTRLESRIGVRSEYTPICVKFLWLQISCISHREIPSEIAKFFFLLVIDDSDRAFKNTLLNPEWDKKFNKLWIRDKFLDRDPVPILGLFRDSTSWST